MGKKPITMVEYYETQAFNPVLIRVEDPQVWQDHVAKRRHLYESHLGIPLPFLRDRRVLEFGCNSGENALVLATFGARLTFVEPNPLVAPRLRQLFRSFDQEGAIEAFHQADIGSFESEDSFDLVVAEGFLSTLQDRDAMLTKIIRLVRPGGFGVVSFNDRIGGLLEMLKRALLFRAYALASIDDVQSGQALEIAKRFFEEDFLKLKASRSFETWWRDTLVTPVYLDSHLWSYPEMLAILQQQGVEIHATSPVWSSWGHFRWYKDVPGPSDRNAGFLEAWQRNLFFFVTGLRPSSHGRPAPPGLLEEAAQLVRTLSMLGSAPSGVPSKSLQCQALLEFIGTDPHEQAQDFAAELARLFLALGTASAGDLLAAYKGSTLLRSLWGTAYHYLCFRKPTD